MAILKRWWWLGLIVVVAAAGLLYMLGGQGAKPGASSSGSQGSGSGAPAPTTSVPGATPATVPAPSAPGTKPSATAVAPAGKLLATITVPPSETLAQIVYSAARDGQTYDVVIRPYGTGPARAGHGTVIVKIDSSKAQKTYKDAVALKGMNALVELGPKALGGVGYGGRYSGVIRFLRRGDVLVLELVSAKAL